MRYNKRGVILWILERPSEGLWPSMSAIQHLLHYWFVPLVGLFFFWIFCVDVSVSCFDYDVPDSCDHASLLCHLFRNYRKKLEESLCKVKRDPQVLALLPYIDLLRVWFTHAFVSLRDVATECAWTRIYFFTVLASKRFSLLITVIFINLLLLRLVCTVWDFAE